MTDETSNPDPEAVAREVSYEITLSISSQLTHGQLKDLDGEGEDISEDNLIAELLGSRVTEDDSTLIELLENDGFIISKCTVNISMPEKD